MLQASDLIELGVPALLERAEQLRETRPAQVLDGELIGLLFLTSSLRTRLGYAAAANRLGGRHIDLAQLRFGPSMGAAESLEDTVRTITSTCGVLVARAEESLRTDALRRVARCPMINGGDNLEHPTQALIDLFAIRTHRGPWSALSITIIGDLRMRSVRSLLTLLAEDPPAALTLVAPQGRELPAPVPPRLRTMTRLTREPDYTEADVVYLSGLPVGGPGEQLAPGVSERYACTAQALQDLPAKSVVLSPMPVIDEISPDAREDSRVRVFEQSQDGVLVRTALLEHVARSR